MRQEDKRMLNYKLLPDRKVLIVEPQAVLEVADFERLGRPWTRLSNVQAD